MLEATTANYRFLGVILCASSLVLAGCGGSGDADNGSARRNGGASKEGNMQAKDVDTTDAKLVAEAFVAAYSKGDAGTACALLSVTSSTQLARDIAEDTPGKTCDEVISRALPVSRTEAAQANVCDVHIDSEDLEFEGAYVDFKMGPPDTPRGVQLALDLNKDQTWGINVQGVEDAGADESSVADLCDPSE